MKKNFDTGSIHGSAIDPVSKFFFMNTPKIAAHGLHMTSLDDT